MISEFYDEISPFYHLIYGDWAVSIVRQTEALESIIREFWGEKPKTVLDLSCGIGTQALGLSQLGFALTASDLSPQSIERAKQEAEKRGLSIEFSVADMRKAFEHHGRSFDIVIACDNAVPHLLSDDEILTAFKQFYLCTNPGGGCIISVRDYAAMELTGTQVKTFGVRYENGIRYLIFQVWEFQGLIYDLNMYFIEDRGDKDCKTHVMRSRYYAIAIDRLIELMRMAGYEDVQRLDDRFFQPVIVGTRS